MMVPRVITREEATFWVYFKDRKIGFIDGFAIGCEINRRIENDSKVWRHKHMEIQSCHLLSQRKL